VDGPLAEPTPAEVSSSARFESDIRLLLLAPYGGLLTERRTELVRLSWWSWPVHGDGPGGVNLSPILGGTPLIDDPVKNVGVNDVGSSDRDVVARSRCRRRGEAAGIGIVIPEENPLPVLGNDLHDEVGSNVIGAGLEPVGWFE
jgi:hypothetical protein